MPPWQFFNGGFENENFISFGNNSATYQMKGNSIRITIMLLKIDRINLKNNNEK